MAKTVGEMIRRSRLERGWKLGAFASEMGMHKLSWSYICRIEQGQQVASPPVFMKMVKSLGLDVDVMVNFFIKERLAQVRKDLEDKFDRIKD